MGRALRILDFDLENRPLSYLGSDYTTGDITAIAAGWTDEPDENIQCWVQTKDDRSRRRMLVNFVRLYDQADMVTGHFIRGYDLPVINGALMELQLPILSDKLTCDTKQDLKKRKYISASQENLSAMFDIAEQKVQMNTPKWREANRLTPAGIELTRERCIGDVVQHKAMRRVMLELDLLGPPRVWRSGGSKDGDYVP